MNANVLQVFHLCIIFVIFKISSTSIISFDCPHKGESCSWDKSWDCKSRGLRNCLCSLVTRDAPHFLCPHRPCLGSSTLYLGLTKTMNIFHQPGRNRPMYIWGFFVYPFVCFFVKLLNQLPTKSSSPGNGVTISSIFCSYFCLDHFMKLRQHLHGTIQMSTSSSSVQNQ